MPLFELAGLLALLLIGWVAFRLYEITPGADAHRERLTEARDAFFRLGASIPTNLTKLDDSWKSAVQSRATPAIGGFQNMIQEWRQWLDRENQRAERANLKPAGSNQPGGSEGPREAERLNLVRRTFLTKVEEAYTNYVDAAQYLLTNSGQPWIRSRLAGREKTIRDQSEQLLTLAQQARTHGEEIESLLSRPGGWSQEMRENVPRLRLVLLLAVVGLSFLFLLGLYRRKQAETRAVLRQHSEQQARLDKLAYFSSRLAQEHAHEIKQPLTAINAHLYTLQKTLTPGSAPQKDATVIRSEITRLNQIVEKFLKQARPAEAEPVDLTADQVLGEVRDLMASQMEQQAIEFRYEVERDLEMRADPQQLKQVLINLVKNAAESISGDGVIILRAKPGIRQLKEHADAVTLIEVEDTGPGIPAEIQGKIFDPFFSTKKRGSGLGLAISARIIEQHGGRLEFDTRVGQGTIFRIVLPASRKEQVEQLA